MKVCLLGLVAILLLQCCAGHTHKNQAHHGHHHGGHVHQQSPLSSGPSEALNEQSFYIQQLFRRYGQLDRLDFNGFQNLLLSLGLGQVRLLGLEHESLGHDHVAHLDMLEVQEGHHTHGPHVSTPGQEHSEPVQDRTSVQHSLCQPAAAGVTAHPTESPEDQDLKGGRQHEHKVEWDEPEQAAHSHRHAGDQQEAGVAESSSETPDSRSSRPRKPSRNKGSRSKARGHGSQEHDHDHKRISDQNHDHAHNRSHDQKHLRDPEHISDQNHDPDQIRDRDRSHDSGQDSNPLQDRDHGHGKQHVRKRAAAERSGQASHNEDVLHQHEECLNLTQLLLYYGLNPEALISPTQFSYLCPALLYQIDSRVCIKHYHQVAVQPSAQEPNHTVWPWLWGFISITIISLLSLLGVLLVPIINQSCFKFLLTFLVALAVGTLSGDALLHLLPHSQEEHDHSVPSPAEQDIDMATLFDGVWKGLTALAGIYMLFIIEHCIGIFKHYRDQQESWCTSQRKAEEAEIGRKLSDHQMKRQSDVELMQLKVPPAAGSDSSALSPGLPQSDPKTPSPHGESSPVSESVRKPKVWGHSHHGHSHHGHCHSDQEMKEAGIASIAWMVIMGDGMHNFSDGLAIGAAFSANVTGGISTSVAVFCHELPHELGDFAVLLKAGMSVKQAVVYNVLSALMAYVGMVIGTAVGQYTHNVTSWIFAVTAGMFLYVALVDMLPEMLHGDSEDHKRCQMGHFLLQNLGMLSGFAIMLLIAIFEDRIVLDFGL